MGFSVATTVLAKAASYNLTDLATAKIELGIDPNDTSQDGWLMLAIRRVSAAIANYTERTFPPEVVQDVFDIQQDAYPYQTPGGFADLQLSRFPALAVLSIVQSATPGMPQTLVEGTDFRVDQSTGQLLRLNRWTGAGSCWEAAPVTVQYVAGFGSMVLENGVVPQEGPFAVTVSGVTSFSCAVSVSYAEGPSLTCVGANPVQGQYSVAAGAYTFAAADAGAALAFSYATASVPDDVVDVALQLITGRYASKDRDPALVQRETPGIGVERFWIGTTAGQTGPFPPDLAGILDAYAMPVIA